MSQKNIDDFPEFVFKSLLIIIAAIFFVWGTFTVLVATKEYKNNIEEKMRIECIKEKNES